MAAETKVTMLFFVFVFCLVLMSSNARMLLEGKDGDSTTLFHKLGFELPNVDQMSFGGSFRFAPSGVDPHHHLTPQLKTSEGLHQPLREAPDGPDPHHHLTLSNVQFPLREAPDGPDPHHHLTPPNVQFPLREAPAGPDPHHHITPPIVQFPLDSDLSNMGHISFRSPATINH
jgi:hypothetical protein